MNILPRNLYTAASVRELDRIAIDEYQIDGLELMTRAGYAAYKLTQEIWPQARRFIILAGPGNNGGYGFIVAQRASDLGMIVEVYLLSAPDSFTPTAARAYDQLATVDVQVQELDLSHINEFIALLDSDGPPGSVVLIDALFGTGLDRDIDASLGQLFTAINNHPVPVLALDIPSGLHADSGRLLGYAIKADVTISFIGLKQGMLTGWGPEFCGAIHFDALQLPDSVYDTVNPTTERIDYTTMMLEARSALAPRSRGAHKGDFGHALIVGGGPGMAGAVRMAAEAAARVGAGLVSVATHPDHAVLVCALRPEIMVHALTGTDPLSRCLGQAGVVAIGPGLGQSDWARQNFGLVLDRVTASAQSIVVDADALNILAAEGLRYDRWILTPHPGEAARLLGITTSEVQSDRLAVAAAIQQRYGGVCVLKGAGTIVRSNERCYVCSGGNPGMASGGMGDVLTGVIAGLLAQGVALSMAAELGVCIHAEAADSAAKEGQRGLLATDLFPFFRRLVNPG